MVYNAAGIVLDILINRSLMIREDQFAISMTASEFGFTSVTVPQLKFIGAMALRPPVYGNPTDLPRAQGLEIRDQYGLNSRARTETVNTMWSVAAELMIVCGNTTKEIELGTISRTNTVYDTASEIWRQERSERRRRGVSKVIGSISNATKSLSQQLSGENSENQIFNLVRIGPTLTLEVGTEQVEEVGGPGLQWILTAGVSIDFEFGVRINLYEVLKRAANATRHPAARALVLALEELEGGVNWLVAEGRLTPSLYMQITVGIGSGPTEDLSGDANVNARYDFMAKQLDLQGHITGTLNAVVGGGIAGYVDSIFTERTVFNYTATAATTGGIIIKSESNQWGYQLFHRGAVVRVSSMRRYGGQSGDDADADNGQNRVGPGSLSSATKAATTFESDLDRTNTNAYRLTEAWEGRFVPF